jgi:hypothetical protein
MEAVVLLARVSNQALFLIRQPNNEKRAFPCTHPPLTEVGERERSTGGPIGSVSTLGLDRVCIRTGTSTTLSEMGLSFLSYVVYSVPYSASLLDRLTRGLCFPMWT